MSPNLKGRLSRLRELGLAPASEVARRPESRPGGRERPSGSGGAASREAGAALSRGPGDGPSFLQGWERLCDLVWARTLRFGLAFPESLDSRPFDLARLARERKGRAGRLEGGPPEGESRIAREELRLLDFETSGLSGGAGTVAFLAAVGSLDADGLSVRQFFLEDYPGEAGYLEALVAELLGGAVVLTYNGRAFDLPLLRTRCVMNGMAPPLLRDLDALASSRRLWKSVLGGASLGLLEREVLGAERELDVPGAAIPGIWFEYLRKGDHPLMGAVMSHNAYDISTLASIAARIDSAFAAPRRHAASSAVDRAGLGRGLLVMGKASEGEELLEAAAADGDEAAGLFLSRRYRREGRPGDRRRVLDLLPSTYVSSVERAKFHEHSARDLAEARRWAGKAERLASTEEESAAVAARIARLERKAGRG